MLSAQSCLLPMFSRRVPLQMSLRWECIVGGGGRRGEGEEEQFGFSSRTRAWIPGRSTFRLWTSCDSSIAFCALIQLHWSQYSQCALSIVFISSVKVYLLHFVVWNIFYNTWRNVIESPYFKTTYDSFSFL